MRWEQPSPFEELSHTADIGVIARGGSREEAYARAALGMALLQAGGGPLEALHRRPLAAAGEDRGELLVDLCRALLRFFWEERLLLCAIEIDELGEQVLRGSAWLCPFDPERHRDGMEIKAVTYFRAAVEREPSGLFRATVLFDI